MVAIKFARQLLACFTNPSLHAVALPTLAIEEEEEEEEEEKWRRRREEEKQQKESVRTRVNERR
jgi:hypothetical protein